MSAYILASLQITDPVLFEEYRSRVPAVIAAHGGRYLVRGGSVDVLEGDALGNRLVIVEFPDMSRLKAFYRSPEYQPLVQLRNRAAISTLMSALSQGPACRWSAVSARSSNTRIRRRWAASI